MNRLLSDSQKWLEKALGHLEYSQLDTPHG
jgi:hypothetical protein